MTDHNPTTERGEGGGEPTTDDLLKSLDTALGEVREEKTTKAEREENLLLLLQETQKGLARGDGTVDYWEWINGAAQTLGQEIPPAAETMQEELRKVAARLQEVNESVPEILERSNVQKILSQLRERKEALHTQLKDLARGFFDRLVQNAEFRKTAAAADLADLLKSAPFKTKIEKKPDTYKNFLASEREQFLGRREVISTWEIEQRITRNRAVIADLQKGDSTYAYGVDRAGQVDRAQKELAEDQRKLEILERARHLQSLVDENLFNKTVGWIEKISPDEETRREMIQKWQRGELNPFKGYGGERIWAPEALEKISGRTDEQKLDLTLEHALDLERNALLRNLVREIAQTQIEGKYYDSSSNLVNQMIAMKGGKREGRVYKWDSKIQTVGQVEGAATKVWDSGTREVCKKSLADEREYLNWASAIFRTMLGTERANSLEKGLSFLAGLHQLPEGGLAKTAEEKERVGAKKEYQEILAALAKAEKRREKPLEVRTVYSIEQAASVLEQWQKQATEMLTAREMAHKEAIGKLEADLKAKTAELQNAALQSRRELENLTYQLGLKKDADEKKLLETVTDLKRQVAMLQAEKRAQDKRLQAAREAVGDVSPGLKGEKGKAIARVQEILKQ